MTNQVKGCPALDIDQKSFMTQLLDIDDLAKLLKRSPRTLLRDLPRNPDGIPPRLRRPGTRLLRWRESDVLKWFDALAGNANQDTEVPR